MIYLATAGASFSFTNVIQLLGLVVLFIIILAAAYFTARFVGTSGVAQIKNRNIKVIETFKLSPSKYLQIIEVGGRYIVIGVCKDHIEYLTELEEDKVQRLDQEISALSFKDVFAALKEKKDKTHKNNL